MRKPILLCCALLLLAGAAFAAPPRTIAPEFQPRLEAFIQAKGEKPDGDRLRELFDMYWDFAMHEYPEFATYTGFPGQNDRWTDNSVAANEARDALMPLALRAIDSIDRNQLSEQDRVNYDLFRRDVESGVEGDRFPGEYLQIDQMGGVQQRPAEMLVQMPKTNQKQVEDILARLREVPTLVEQTLALLEKGLAAGVTPPRVTLREVPQQVKNLLTDDPAASPLLVAFKEMPAAIPAAEQERLRREAADAYRTRVRPAYEKLHGYLVETYLPGARESISMSALPDGQAWYAFNAEQSTTTDLTPQQIHDIGLAEVKRIRAEMDQVIAATGFKGSFAEFLSFLRTDPRFFYDQPEDLIAGYRDIAKRVDPELVKLFGKLPRLPYGVLPVPSYAEKSQTTAYYNSGSLEAGRPGYFYANTYDLKSRPKWEMEALTLHEAVPGHHLQIALAQELEDVPEWRRHQGYTAFVEGWGLYAESLGEQMGLYKDPYAKFGQLTYEMWRAVRLVVDTGMHALGWTREQAIDYFKQNAGKAEHDITVEVDRYIVWPGQALAYKIGELKIKELRGRAQKALGPKFDLRAFHDQVLGNGAVPLSVLEANVAEWVAAGGPASQPAAAAPAP
ncbi:MAG TPA: DUF885 domain-containing protein [Thermoanaerobaculia bacterium]|nr:DUF885 domain-containing protein [Thermoanaerobaculia bacterium]